MNNAALKIILAALALGGGVILLLFFVNKNVSDDVTISENLTLPRETKKTEAELQFQTAEIIKSGDFERCDKIKDETYKKVCINNIASKLALEKGDVSYCRKIDDNLMPRSECEENTIFLQSVNTENADLCKQLSGQESQDECARNFYLQLALKKNDVSICARQSGKEQADACHDNFLVKNIPDGEYKNFSCSSLAGKEEQEDCKKIKENINLAEVPEEVCLSLKTSLFSLYCAPIF